MNLTVPKSTARSSPVMLSAAKHLAASRDRPFAEFTLSEAHVLRVTRYDCSNSQVQFVQIEPCLIIASTSWPITISASNV